MTQLPGPGRKWDPAQIWEARIARGGRRFRPINTLGFATNHKMPVSPTTRMNTILAWTDDLIFFSRIHGVAAKMGLVAKQVRRADAFDGETGIGLVLVDIQVAGENLAAVAGDLLPKGVRMVGYGSHVDAAGLRAARELGLNPVMPRSQFVERLPLDLFGWVGRGCCS